MALRVAKQQTFTCGACGKTVTAKLKVPAEDMNEPVPEPENWFAAMFMGQDSRYGAIAALRIFADTEVCAEKIARGEGPGGALARSFQGFLTSIGARAAEPAVEEDEEEPEYDEGDDDGPKVPQA